MVTLVQVQEVRAVPQVEQAEPLGESTLTVDAGDGA